MKLKTFSMLLIVIVMMLGVIAVSADDGGTFTSPIPTPEPPEEQPLLPVTGDESLFDKFGNWLLEMWGLGGVQAIVAQTLINVALAVAAAIHLNEFDARKIGQFLYRKLLPYVSVYIAVKAAGVAAGVEWLAPVVYATIFATLTGDMLDNLVRLGLKVPEGVQKVLLSR